MKNETGREIAKTINTGFVKSGLRRDCDAESERFPSKGERVVISCEARTPHFSLFTQVQTLSRIAKFAKLTKQFCPLPQGEREQVSFAKQTVKNLLPFTSHFSREGKRVAFTLAEVLITLGIIGVVAAMTMSVLIQNYQKTVTVNRLKETYAKLAQSVNFAQSENGNDPEGYTLNQLLEETEAQFSITATKYFTDNYIVPYFKTIKILEGTPLNRGGYPLYKDLAGDIDADARFFYGKDDIIITVELANGAILYILTGGGGRYTENKSGFTIMIFVDVNGLKNPNVTGKDLFVMSYYTKTKKLSMLWLDNQVTRDLLLSKCSKGAGTISNRACGALIQFDGWQIKDDYPW